MTRILDRVEAVTEIADFIRSGRFWVIGAALDMVSPVAESMPAAWHASSYLDAGNDMILADAPGLEMIAGVMLPVVGIDASCVFVISKDIVSGAELNHWRPEGSDEIPEDGSQDLVIYYKPHPTNPDQVIALMPGLLYEAGLLVH